jgi:transposase-like protein
MGRQPFAKRKHSPEFKIEAVRLMKQRLADGLTLQRVSEELEIGPDLLRVWGRQVDEAPSGATPREIFPGQGRRRPPGSKPGPKVTQPLPLQAEVDRLRRENERLRLERDFLKKAAAFFAKESR